MFFRRNKNKQTKYRDDQAEPPLSGVIWLLGALLLVVIPHFLRLPLWMSASCLVIIAWRILVEYKQWPLPSAFIKLVITLGLVAITYYQFQTFNGLAAGSALLTIMLCLKLLEMKTIRDTMVVVFLGYFLVAVSFLFDQSILFGFYLFSVVLALTTALVILNHPQASTSHHKFYLNFASSLLLQAIPLMLILFVLFPRISGPLWSLPEDKSSAIIGLNDQMNIGEITHIAESEEVAFRVKFDSPPPSAKDLYWRGPVLWYTNGRRWQGIHDQFQLHNLTSKEPIAFSGEGIDYTVTLQPHQKKWLFALDLPSTIPTIAKLGIDYQLLAETPVNNVTRYSVTSHPQYTTGEAWPFVLQAGLQLPDHRNPKTRELAHQWSQQGLMPQQIVDKALALFREQPYFYSRTPPALTSHDPIDEFLFNSRRGFCEHYAASFVTLMRSASVPARVVTGYQGGEFNPMGNYLIVRQSRAHAWAEVWLEQQGWVRVDPTAVIPNERVESFGDTQRFQTTVPEQLMGNHSTWVAQQFLQLRNSWDAVNHEWNQWVLGYGSDRQLQLLDKLGLGKLTTQQLIIIMIILVAAIIVATLVYLLIQRKNTGDPISDGYNLFCNKLSCLGITRQPWQGPQDYGDLASAKFPHLKQQINTITQYYIALRYGPSERYQSEKFVRLVKRFKP